jgi:hypothetical protein
MSTFKMCSSDGGKDSTTLFTKLYHGEISGQNFNASRPVKNRAGKLNYWDDDGLSLVRFAHSSMTVIISKFSTFLPCSQPVSFHKTCPLIPPVSNFVSNVVLSHFLLRLQKSPQNTFTVYQYDSKCLSLTKKNESL